MEAFGARYLFDTIVPGGVASDLPQPAYAHLLYFYRVLEHEVAGLRLIYDEHGGLQDRFREAGHLGHDLALRLGAVGLVARASGIARDLRFDLPWAPYNGLATQIVTEGGGDVAARVQVRFREIFESLRLCRALLADLSHTSTQDPAITTALPEAEPIIETMRGRGYRLAPSLPMDPDAGTDLIPEQGQ